MDRNVLLSKLFRPQQTIKMLSDCSKHGKKEVTPYSAKL